MTLLSLSVRNLTARSSRQAAVDMMVASFEQARIAAVRHKANVYVAFANTDNGFDQDHTFRAFTIFRDRNAHDTHAATSLGFVPITDWRKLPDGISFRSDAGSVISDGYLVPVETPNNNITEVPAMKFNQNGSIAQPAGNTPDLLIYNGFFDNRTGRDIPTANSSRTLSDYFSFSRSTGRVKHEVISLE